MESPRWPTLSDVVAELAARGIVLPDAPIRLDYNGDSPDLSKSLLALIRSVRKPAGNSRLWLWEHEKEPIGSAGDIEIVLTRDHQPSIVTRITRVEIVPCGRVECRDERSDAQRVDALFGWAAVDDAHDASP